MRFMTGMLLMGATLSGCVLDQQGVFLYQLGETTYTDPTSSCEENLVGMKCPEGSGPIDSNGWEYVNDGEESLEAGFLQIVDSLGAAESYMVIDGRIYVGTQAGNVYTYTWENFERITDERSHSASGYSYRVDTDITVTTTVVLTRTGNNYEGTMTVDGTSKVTRIESDRWNTSSEVPTGGDIGNDTSGLELLDNGTSENSRDIIECEDDQCKTVMTQSGSQSRPITVTKTDADNEAYISLSGAGQAGGASEFRND